MDGIIRFCCPVRQFLDHNGRLIVALGKERWSCWRCARNWMRSRFQRLALEDAIVFEGLAT